MYRSTQQHLVASNALPDEKMSQISSSAEDAEAVGRANANPNLYRHRGGEFSLSESFEFVHNTLTCPEIDDHSIRQKEGSQDSDLQAPDPWTQMYVKIMDDVRIALATALVPVIHTQVRSNAEQADARGGEERGRSSHDASTFCTSRGPASSMNVGGDDEDRATESPKRWEESELTCCSNWTSSHFPTSLIMREEDIPEIDGRKVVITRRKELTSRADPFVAEFYRTSVAPLLE